MKIIIFCFLLFLIINEEKSGNVNACACAKTPFEKMYCDSEWGEFKQNFF
uniref:Uncharacterized protein n=1 Tax=Meloidogyne enterolobii TaxID=390850 RepID=A0A6V7Y6B4_MELEN|nr:unnamed protein product [Meloidogyne enterolobii]